MVRLMWLYNNALTAYCCARLPERTHEARTHELPHRVSLAVVRSDKATAALAARARLRARDAQRQQRKVQPAVEEALCRPHRALNCWWSAPSHVPVWKCPAGASLAACCLRSKALRTAKGLVCLIVPATVSKQTLRLCCQRRSAACTDVYTLALFGCLVLRGCHAGSSVTSCQRKQRHAEGPGHLPVQ